MKKKQYADDDGRTIINMNVDGMPWYNPNVSDRKNRNKEDEPKKKELFAMIGGAFSAYLPSFLITFACLCLAFLFVYVWFKGWKI